MQPFAGAVIDDITFDHVYFGKTACCNVIVLGDTVSSNVCSTLHITNSVLFGTPNKGACGSLDLEQNTTYTSTAQAGCARPPARLSRPRPRCRSRSCASANPGG